MKLTRFQPKVFNEEEKEAMRQKLIEGNRKQDRDVLRCPEKLIAGRTTFKIRNKIHAKIAALTARLAEKMDNAETINANGTKDQEIADGDKVIMELDKAKKQGALIDQVNAFIKNGIPERSKILPENVGLPRITVTLFGTYSGSLPKTLKQLRFITNRGCFSCIIPLIS